MFRLFIAGLEISDVLKIDDKDYSITFSLYFNVQWSEPRLNLSREFMDTENITAEEDQLVPGIISTWTNKQFLTVHKLKWYAEKIYYIIYIYIYIC